MLSPGGVASESAVAVIAGSPDGSKRESPQMTSMTSAAMIPQASLLETRLRGLGADSSCRRSASIMSSYGPDVRLQGLTPLR